MILPLWVLTFLAVSKITTNIELTLEKNRNTRRALYVLNSVLFDIKRAGLGVNSSLYKPIKITSNRIEIVSLNLSLSQEEDLWGISLASGFTNVITAWVYGKIKKGEALIFSNEFILKGKENAKVYDDKKDKNIKLVQLSNNLDISEGDFIIIREKSNYPDIVVWTNEEGRIIRLFNSMKQVALDDASLLFSNVGNSIKVEIEYKNISVKGLGKPLRK